MFFEPHLPSLEAQSLVTFELNLHLKFPRLEETCRGDIKTHLPTLCSPSLCSCGQAPWSKPIDLGNLVRLPQSGIPKD